jgi:hypothetical protein
VKFDRRRWTFRLWRGFSILFISLVGAGLLVHSLARTIFIYLAFTFLACVTATVLIRKIKPS